MAVKMRISIPITVKTAYLKQAGSRLIKGKLRYVACLLEWATECEERLILCCCLKQQD